MDPVREAPDGSPTPAGPHDPLDASTDAAAVVSGEGVVIGWTRGAEALLGHRAAEVVGGSAAPLVAMPGDPARVAGVAARCRAGMGWSGLIPVRHHDGRTIDVDLRVSASFRIGADECFLISAREQRPQWTVGRSILDGFLTRSPIGMAVMDRELRYVWLNDTLERFGGVPREQRLGRRLSELLPGLQTATIEGLMREVLDTGVPVTDYEYLGWSWADPHRRHAYSTSFFPLLDADDSVTGVCYMVQDVTERWHARRLLTLVNEAGARVGTTLDVMRTAQELADFAVPRFADFVVVDLLEHVFSTEGHGTWLTDAGPAPVRPVLRRAGLASAREGAPEAVARIGDRSGFFPPAHDVKLLIDGEPILIPVLDPSDAMWADEPRRAASIREFGLHSLISVPMRARNTALGITTFVRSLNPAPFQPDDVLPARELVARAALCVDNARRYTREHTAAVTLQRSLLPQALTGGTALEVASAYLPADATGGVGGDWFDVIPLSGARVGLVVGDVVGHGITAAATMGRLRTAVQTLADMEMPPDELLAHLDDLLLRLSAERSDDEAAHQPTPVFLGATCLYAVYDPVTRRCTMARAGHPPPVVIAPDGQVSFPQPPPGPPLGLGGVAFEATEIELAENSLIGLYTDGLIEGGDRDMERGMPRLAEVLARCDADLGTLCTSAVRQLVPVPQPDDIALLLARTHALRADQVVSWDVPVDPAVVADVRARAIRQVVAWGLDDLAMTTELVVSELVTNAIRYAAPPIRLRLLHDARLTCEVSDASSTAPRLRHARSLDEGGRGLFLVAQLSHRWGTRYTADGKIIWAEQEIP
ncbi:SpoIIE family protein phosphatase [Streptomyces ipomoeae]|uniref:SpoIIE family protein phosphatase n=2 Tax=Streptomyces ipomoeae TaxID=103232 RepID=UPI0011477039|nr:SpoIIE family protein phosphatase [Streptomyces ipomoeae]MDX2698920.1 SpoIIE family protein phosphatase [Streptomyces ipomoeae]MDX2827326.1 SpoIIE family protein phosphatase [Streptomyces ipomoeae]MDX2843425.1 SpoIIE family protein phosphatase [Streptomyces ipomoeae]MDX2879984.1 SpoIIE family protein phosphatase [Streptomyces ipomoeae]TQE19524.1 PAS domain S-box protein [Streptomyces ipomoeae]